MRLSGDEAPDDPRPTRRTEGVRTKGRAARVVRAVLTATAEELSSVGYAALRIEAVAARSGVNKTTIYRRWPSKPALVAAALRDVLRPEPLPDTGSLREDLRVAARSVRAFACSRLGRGLLRVVSTERADPELDAIARRLRASRRRARVAIVERAVDRGELPAGARADWITELVFAPVLARVTARGARADDAFIDGVIDVVLAGARATFAR